MSGFENSGSIAAFRLLIILATRFYNELQVNLQVNGFCLIERRSGRNGDYFSRTRLSAACESSRSASWRSRPISRRPHNNTNRHEVTTSTNRSNPSLSKHRLSTEQHQQQQQHNTGRHLIRNPLNKNSNQTLDNLFQLKVTQEKRRILTSLVRTTLSYLTSSSRTTTNETF